MGLASRIDHAEEVAIGVCKNHKVRVLGIVPLDLGGAERLEAFDLGKLLLFVGGPEIEVGAVRLVQMQPGSASLARQQEVWVGPTLIPQCLAPERGSSGSVRHVQDDRSDADHDPNLRSQAHDDKNRLQQNGGVIEMGREHFEELVGDALDGVPPDLAALMDNVVVLVEDQAPAYDRELLGLYDGTPLTERDSTYTGVMPDRITIFREPILQMCTSDDEVVDEVRITVVHEIAHHFGIDDARLHDLGYG